MMSETAKSLIIDLALERISEDEFLMLYPADPRINVKHVTEALEASECETDAVAVECALILGFRYGFLADCASVLCRLIAVDWHEQHEDVALALGELSDPATVECLYQTAHREFPYLAYDENRGLAVKCVYALGRVGTPEAKCKLEQLSQSQHPTIREAALRNLN